MKIKEGSYRIITKISEGGVDELKFIEDAARECYKSTPGDFENTKAFVRGLIRNGHLAMIEHAPSLSVEFNLDRGFTHEMVRHRLFSFAQESTRYCNYNHGRFDGGVAFTDICDQMLIDPKVSSMDLSRQLYIYQYWLQCCYESERHYNAMINMGCSPQIARSVLINSTKATLRVTGNYREWRSAFNLRCANDAHPVMRSVMKPLLVDVNSKIPVIFEDLVEKFGLDKNLDIDDEETMKNVEIKQKYHDFRDLYLENMTEEDFDEEKKD